MPLAKSGKYFSNPARMRQADSMAPQDAAAPDDVDGNQADADDDSEGQSVTITKKPDGSFCTEQGGDVVEHPDMASAIEALGSAFKQQDDPDDADADESLAVAPQASDDY